MSTQVNVVGALLPPPLIELLQKPQQATEKGMLSVSTLIVKLFRETFVSIEKLNIRELDANPGDKGCQMRALILRDHLLSPDVRDELKRVDKIIKQLEIVLKKRKEKQNGDSSIEFFQRHILPLEVSVDLLFLIYCKLLTVTKIKDHVEPNGIVVTRLDHGRLSTLSKDFNERVDNRFRKQMVADAAIALSESSLTCVQEMAHRMHVSPLMLRMIMGVRQNKPQGDFKPKSFGCQFYEVALLLTQLKEQEAIIAIKTVVTEGKPQLILLKPSGPGEEFCFIDAAPKETLLAVFEGVVQKNLSIEAFKERVQKIGLSRLMLVCTAQEEPYEHGSTLDDVTDPEGRAEIESFIKMAPEIDCVKDQNPLWLMDHIFCNSFLQELTQGNLC
jgi:hypothetical protein